MGPSRGIPKASWAGPGGLLGGPGGLLGACWGVPGTSWRGPGGLLGGPGGVLRGLGAVYAKITNLQSTKERPPDSDHPS